MFVARGGAQYRAGRQHISVKGLCGSLPVLSRRGYASGGGREVEVCKTVQELRDFRARRVREGLTPIGFVPTMGGLHQGHLDLMRQARALGCKTVISSIYVNPAQFAAHEDFDKYPRDHSGDIGMMRETPHQREQKLKSGEEKEEGQGEGLGASLSPAIKIPDEFKDQPLADAVFTPSFAEMYHGTNPDPFGSEDSTFVHVKGLSDQLEGSVRPHFFYGVATVVCKLLNATGHPDILLLGQKDAQQCVVLRRMVRDLLFDTQVFITRTTRDPDGLAMSSRNRYLSPEERNAGLVLPRTLCHLEAVLNHPSEERKREFETVGDVLRYARGELAKGPLSGDDCGVGVELQYVSVNSASDLRECGEEERWEDILRSSGGYKDDVGVFISAAILCGKTRLIDNVIIRKRKA
eukprot:Nk52_evm4s1671 gene=Nk52_evmTU4s1671